MPSPDVTGYVDLSIYDRYPQDLFDTALATLQLRMPGWVPREGNTEVLLMEALALEVSYAIFAANRVPGAITSVILQLLGLAPLEGLPASATFEFEGATDAGFTVPAGTRVQIPLSNTVTAVFATDEELVVVTPNTTGQVTATATETGTAPHAVVPGVNATIVDALAAVQGVELITTPAGGRDAETDEEFLDRGTERLLRMTEALVLPSHFERYALEQDNVYRAKAIDLYDPGTGPNPGDNNGHTTVAVAGLDGTTLTTQEKTDLETEMEAAAHAGLDVHVVDPDLFTVDVSVTVVKTSGTITDAVVQANVEALLGAYFDTNNWDWDTTIYLNEIIALADSAVGVERVTAVTIGLNGGAQSAADTALASEYPLTVPGAFVVTVA